MHKCQGTFSVRQGTAYFGVRAEEPNDTIAMRALAEGHSLRGTGRIVDVDKPTVSPLLTSVASRNLLLYQSLPTRIPYRQAKVRRRKDDTGVGAALGR